MKREQISGRSITFRIPPTLSQEVEEAMNLAGVLKVSDFTRQALVLRVREVKATAQNRKVVSPHIHFARRPRAKKEAA